MQENEGGLQWRMLKKMGIGR